MERIQRSDTLSPSPHKQIMQLPFVAGVRNALAPMLLLSLACDQPNSDECTDTDQVIITGGATSCIDSSENDCGDDDSADNNSDDDTNGNNDDDDSSADAICTVGIEEVPGHGELISVSQNGDEVSYADDTTLIEVDVYDFPITLTLFGAPGNEQTRAFFGNHCTFPINIQYGESTNDIDTSTWYDSATIPAGTVADISVPATPMPYELFRISEAQ